MSIAYQPRRAPTGVPSDGQGVGEYQRLRSAVHVRWIDRARVRSIDGACVKRVRRRTDHGKEAQRSDLDWCWRCSGSSNICRYTIAWVNSFTSRPPCTEILSPRKRGAIRPRGEPSWYTRMPASRSEGCLPALLSSESSRYVMSNARRRSFSCALSSRHRRIHRLRRRSSNVQAGTTHRPAS